MHAFNRALCQRLSSEGIAIAGVYCCTVHPTRGRRPLSVRLAAAKAASGNDAASRPRPRARSGGELTIGDKKSDVQAGQAAGCRTILLATGAGGRGETIWRHEPITWRRTWRRRRNGSLVTCDGPIAGTARTRNVPVTGPHPGASALENRRFHSELDRRCGDVHAHAARLRRNLAPSAKLVGILRPYVADCLAGTSWLDDMIYFDRRSDDPAMWSGGHTAACASRSSTPRSI